MKDGVVFFQETDALVRFRKHPWQLRKNVFRIIEYKYKYKFLIYAILGHHYTRLFNDQKNEQVKTVSLKINCRKINIFISN